LTLAALTARWRSWRRRRALAHARRLLENAMALLDRADAVEVAAAPVRPAGPRWLRDCAERAAWGLGAAVLGVAAGSALTYSILLLAPDDRRLYYRRDRGGVVRAYLATGPGTRD
jgi:hypothetical protein